MDKERMKILYEAIRLLRDMRGMVSGDPPDLDMMSESQLQESIPAET